MLLKRDNVERVTESESVANKLKAQGFRLIEAVVHNQDTDKAVDIVSMTVPELKALAKEKGIEGAGSLKKEELLAVLTDGV